MKNICLLFCIGWLLAGCEKMETRTVFVVNCQFPDFIFIPKGLVITNASGEVLHSFSVPLEATEFKGQFALSSDDPTEKLDYHLILNVSQSPGIPASIFSHLKVSSGELVYFTDGNQLQEKSTPDNLPATAANFTRFTFQGIYQLDSIGIENYPNNPLNTPIFSDSSISVQLLLRDTQNIIARLRANGEPVARYVVLPWQPLGNRDAAVIPWADFKVDADVTPIQLPDNLQAVHSEVTALSPSRRVFTNLANDWNGGPPYDPQFRWPDEFKTGTLLRVFVETNSASFEQIFQPGQPIRFESSGMVIDGVGVSAGKELAVSTRGDVDMIRVRCSNFPGSFQTGQWQIDGPPDAFANYIFPDLSRFLPPDIQVSQFFNNYIVEAHQFATYNYAEISAGYPWRLRTTDGLFAVANSGHKVVFTQR